MSIFDKYGIKEVADVIFYEIEADGTPGAPVLALDTLKVSTIEQAAETAYATGGKGNAQLIAWDYGKEITVTLEDALFSAKSLAIMFGNGRVDTSEVEILKTIQFQATEDGKALEIWTDANGNVHKIASPKVYDENSKLIEPTAVKKGETYLITFTFKAKNAGTVTISADTYPGTYYVVGDTFARSEKSGKDESFQFVIPKAKITAENTITLEAEGDPSVFSMNITVLRPANKQMMQLIKYDVPDSDEGGEVTP